MDKLTAQDLRVGNFVGDIGNIPYQVYPQTIVGLWQMEIAGRIPLDVNPILITEEWLIDFGFEEDYRSEWTIKFSHNNHNEIGYDWNKTYDWRFRYYGKYIECKYIHQLQNLYFALTGNELTIKEKAI